jgi:alkylhydroperoxidase family enzyme
MVCCGKTFRQHFLEKILMPRIPYPDPAAFETAHAALLAQLAPLNIFRMLSHAPHLVRPFVGLGTAFLVDGKLDPVTRECAILRVGYLAHATYETGQHEAIGRKVGMTEALIEAVKHGPDAAVLTPEQALAVTYTDALVNAARPSDAALAPVLAHFGPAGVQELTLLIGYYMMVCRFLETFGVEIEAGGPAGAAVLTPR